MVKLVIIDTVCIDEYISFAEYKSFESLEVAFKNKNMRLGALGDYDLIGITISGKEYEINRMNLFDWLYARIKR